MRYRTGERPKRKPPAGQCRRFLKQLHKGGNTNTRNISILEDNYIFHRFPTTTGEAALKLLFEAYIETDCRSNDDKFSAGEHAQARSALNNLLAFIESNGGAI